MYLLIFRQIKFMIYKQNNNLFLLLIYLSISYSISVESKILAENS